MEEGPKNLYPYEMKILPFLLFCLIGYAGFGQTAAEWCEKASKSTDNAEVVRFADNALKIDPNNAWAFLLRGVGHLNAGDNQKALVDIDNAIRITPNYPNALNNRGVANFNLGRYVESVKDYDQAIRLDPSYVTAYLNRGISKIQLAKYEESVVDFTESLRLNPEYARAYLCKGQSLFHLKKYQEALDAFAEGEKRDKSLNFHLDDKKSAQNAIRVGLKTDKSEEDWLDMARETVDNNLKIEYAGNAIRINPKNADAFMIRGAARMNSGQNKEAIIDYNEGLKLNSSHAVGYNNRGVAYYNQGLYQEALQNYDLAIKLNPGFADAYNNRGVAKGLLGRYQEAINDYDQLIRIDPKYKRAYFNKGQSLFQLKKYTEALDMFEKGEAMDNSITYHLEDKKRAREALKLDQIAVDWCNKSINTTDTNLKIEYAGNAIKADPGNALGYFLRGHARASISRNQEAMADYSEAIRLNPKYADAYNNRGSLFFDQGNFKAAVEDYNQAIAYNPELVMSFYNRGSAKNGLGDYQDAIIDFEHTLRLDPKYTRAYINKGRSLFNLKQYQEALDFFAQGEALDPTLTYHLEDKKKTEEALRAVAKPEKQAVLLRRFALIIGNSAYDGGKSLEGRPNNDAKDIAARLESVGFKVFRYNDLRKQQDFLEVFRSFGQLAKNADVALFFYAGHGVEVNGENYIIPTQAKLTNREDVDYEAFPVRRVLDEFAKLNTKSNIILLDACRENPFRSWSRGEDRGFKLIDITQTGLDNLFIGYATAPGSVARNGSGRNGVFTSALLKFLYRGQRFDDIFQDTVNEVLIQTKNAQRPFQTSSLRTRLIF